MCAFGDKRSWYVIEFEGKLSYNDSASVYTFIWCSKKDAEAHLGEGARSSEN